MDGTDPSSRNSLALWVVSPSMVPTAMPPRTITPITSGRRSTRAPRRMPRAGRMPLITRALTALIPAELSKP